MKRIIYFISTLATLLAGTQASFGQQHDKYWMGKVWAEYTSILMGFEGESISYQAAADSTPLSITTGIIAMGSAGGELQFYTNGNSVATWDHSIMQGGKGFNEGSPYSDFGVNGADTLYNSNYVSYTYQAVPDAEDGQVYYMVHSFVQYDDDGCKGLNAPHLKISKIDMSANGGLGRVVYKNHNFDEAQMGVAFAMVRHGNGRDWWVVRRSQDGLYYRSVLLQRDSVVQVVQSVIPGLSSDWFGCEDWWATSLNLLNTSRDGSMLLDIFGRGRAKLLDFDRCNGEVSLLDTFTTGFPTLTTASGSVYECPAFTYEFSPSGRYLYSIGCAGIIQWDLWADDIAASGTPIGGVPWQLDENQNVTGLTGGFRVFGHGPDGKIYNLIGSMHTVIAHPDEPGDASGLCLAADSPPSCLGVPYWLYSTPYPNYRLGPLTGSACDTIPTSVHEPPANGGYEVTASPTLASGPVEVTITLPAYGSASAAELLVVDMLGRVLHRHRFPPYAYLHRFDVSGWAAGLYNVVLVDKGRARAGARLVVVR